jgi:hypothetical protein
MGIGDMDVISAVATSLRDEFLHEGIGRIEVNMGSCADFADALSQQLADLGLDVTISGTDYYWAEDGGIDALALARREGVILPPSLSWEQLRDLDFANSASHTWIEHEGLCYDAEMVEGTTNPFDFPCIRHALTEIMEFEAGRLDKLVTEHAWWRQSLDIRLEREASLNAEASFKI